MKTKKPTQKPERLILEYNTYGKDDLGDHIAMLAMNIEDGMLTAGGIPGKDYTFLDVIKLAVEYKKAINQK